MDKFWKKRKSRKENTSLNARQQPDHILERENSVHVESYSFGACFETCLRIFTLPVLSDLNEMVNFPGILLVSIFEREPSLYCFILRNTTDDNNSPDYRGNCRNINFMK